MVLLEGVDAVVAIGRVLGGRGESGVTAPDGSQSHRSWGGPGTDRRKGTAGEALVGAVGRVSLGRMLAGVQVGS